MHNNSARFQFASVELLSYFLDSSSDLLAIPHSYYIEPSPCGCWYGKSCMETILTQTYLKFPLANLEVILFVLVGSS